MLHVSMSQDLPVAADAVWTTIGGFNALPAWHPAVERSELQGEGQKRKLFLAGGATIIEKLEELDDGARTCTYTIEQAPLPVTSYRATLAVHARDDGCTVKWSSEFEAAGAPESEALEAIRGVYQAGFDNLKKLFGG